MVRISSTFGFGRSYISTQCCQPSYKRPLCFGRVGRGKGRGGGGGDESYSYILEGWGEGKAVGGRGW